MKLFPDHWKTDSVSALCTDVVDCVNKTAPTIDGPTEYKMIRTTNVKAGRINLDDCKYVDEATFVKWTRRIQPKRNDIVLTREAPLGEVGLLRSDESVFLGQRTMLYRANPKKLDQRFLYYSMLGPLVQGQIRSQGSGATVEHLRVPDAESFLVAYPPLDEQRRIAALLSAYDDLIANNQRRIALLESMAEEIYREWFVRMRFPGHESQLDAQAEWRLEPLESLGTFMNGYPFDPSEWFDEGLPIVKIKELNSGVGSDTPRNPGDKIPAKYHFGDGDLLFSWSGSLVVQIWHQGSALVNQHLFKVTPAAGVSRSFLYLSIKFSIPIFESLTTGATMQHIKRKELRFVKVRIPPEALMKQFVSAVDPLLENALSLKKQTRRLREMRDALLPRLISGKLRVDQLDIQFPPSMRVETAEAAP